MHSRLQLQAIGRQRQPGVAAAQLLQQIVRGEIEILLADSMRALRAGWHIAWIVLLEDRSGAGDVLHVTERRWLADQGGIRQCEPCDAPAAARTLSSISRESSLISARMRGSEDRRDSLLSACCGLSMFRFESTALE